VIFRAILRLTVIRATRRPVISPPLPEREIDPATLPALAERPTSSPLHEENGHANGNANGTTTNTTPTHLKNNHVTFFSGKIHPLLTTPPTSLTQTTIEDYLLPKALTPSSLRDPRFLLRTLSGPTDWAAEILYILRPLIYVLLSRPSRKPISSLRTPVAVSLMIEVAVRYLRAMPPASASLERAEYARRDRELFWYLFRGEIWSEWTRPKLLGLAQRTSGVPLLALVSAVVGDWVPLINQYHYCK
jgi:peroxin-16